MTEKIYFQNQYQTELTAKIICITQEDNSFHVTLDKTIFYPEGGGQPCDLGTINDINVEYVFEKDDQVIQSMFYKKLPQEILHDAPLILPDDLILCSSTVDSTFFLLSSITLSEEKPEVCIWERNIVPLI